MAKRVLNGLTQPWSYELQPGLNRLGRNPTNDFRVSDASVSSFHCEVVVNDHGVTVRDLGSTNGTFVDEEPIREAQLQMGQRLRLGTAELRLDAEPGALELPRVAIPEMPAPAGLPKASFLADGSPACLQHPELAAAFRCAQCEEHFCEDCVRELRLAGGQPKQFCPSCHGQCERLETPAWKASQNRKKKPGFFGRFTQTLKLPFGKR